MSLSRNGGYGTNLYTGKNDQGEVDHSLVARSKWIWRPATSLKLTLAADYQDLDQDFSYRPGGRISADRPAPRPGLSRRRPGCAEPLPLPLRRRLDQGGCRDREPDLHEPERAAPDARALRRRPRPGTASPCGRPFPPPSRSNSARNSSCNRASRRASDGWRASTTSASTSSTTQPSSAMAAAIRRCSAAASGRPCSPAERHRPTPPTARRPLPIGQATRLTLGLRYTIEHRSVRANGERLFDNAPFVRPIPGLPLLTEAPFRNSDTFRELTWRASLDRHFSDEVMGYVSASRGFQSGGWNLQTPQNPAFGPETLDDFEAGLKYADRSRRFRADANVFYYDYSDLQVSAITPIGQRRPTPPRPSSMGWSCSSTRELGRETDVTLGAAAAAGAVQALSQRDLHQFQRRRGRSLCADHPATSPATACRSRPSSSSMSAPTTASAGQDRHLAAERKPGLQFRLFRGTRQCRAAGSFATVDASAEWRPSRRGPSVRLWVLNLTDAHYYDAPGDRADRRRSSEPGCAAAVWRLDRLCFLGRGTAPA